MEKLKRAIGILFIYSGSVGILTAVFTGLRVLFSGMISSVSDLAATLVVVVIMAAFQFLFIYLGFRLRGKNIFKLKETKESTEAEKESSGKETLDAALNQEKSSIKKGVAEASPFRKFSREAALERGAEVYKDARNYTRYGDYKFADADSDSPLKLILVEERFVNSENETAGFVDLVNEDNRVVSSWIFNFPLKKRFREPDAYDDDCLVLYLKEEYDLPIEQYGWSAYLPKNREVGVLAIKERGK